ncbi:MAG TPA: hypothetical protein VIL43_10620 [Burkholderiales bacterium]
MPSIAARRTKLALLTLLQLSPALAIAALASHDLSGTARKSPTTMGALEAKAENGGVEKPVGLKLTILRNGD